MKLWIGCWIVFSLVSAFEASASLISVGPDGINSAGLTLADNLTLLTGSDVGIGQVEAGRPGKSVPNGGFDDATNSGASVNPTNVFVGILDGAQIANTNVDDHAQRVASVMISTHMAEVGVAPNAKLYSGAIFATGGDVDTEAALATQHVSIQNGGAMRAINLSFVIPLSGGSFPDGNSLYTLFLDWSARQRDVLYVVAGNQVGNAFVVPTDNFNGLTIARSARVGGTGAYRQVSQGNRYDDDADGDRTSINLIAPGEMINTTGLGDVILPASGTSLAAPHVVGTTALLQEYAADRVATVGGPRWTGNAFRHEVMKAVLMNSADKLIDDGTVVVNGNVVPQGSLLGMERTVLKQQQPGMPPPPPGTWLDSDAYDKSYPDGTGVTVPLDLEMGTGHLNARRALQQFESGEYGADGDPVPVIGWDYGSTTGATGSLYNYEFDQPLLGGSFISITLAWDRVIEFDNDGGTIGVFDLGDTFVESPEILTPGWDQYNDLDLYLLKADEFNLSQAIAASTSSSNIEPLFFQIPETGDYKFLVRQLNANGGAAEYAVAWWAVADQSVVMVPGDFNGDGNVDGADFVIWQTNFPDDSGNATLATGDANGDGNVDGADFVVWQTNFPTIGGSTTPVPEPAAGLLAMFAAALLFAVRRRR